MKTRIIMDFTANVMSQYKNRVHMVLGTHTGFDADVVAFFKVCV